MAHSAPYVFSSFKVSARIGEIEFPDVVSVSATFGLNSIPSATLMVATGREVRSNLQATIHEAKDRLRPRDPAVVTLTIETGGGDRRKSPAGEYVIFRGYYVGIGYQRSFNASNYVLYLVHWIDDLNNSSMLNGNWFPGAPYDLAQNAAYALVDPIVGAGAVAPGAQRWSTVPAIDPDGQIITPSNIQSDLWLNVLRPAFTAIANFPSPRYQTEREGQTNSAALSALNRMPGEIGQEYYTPLALDISGLESNNIQYSVQAAISKEALESFAYTTYWSKLVGEYASQFFFAISPSVEFALPVPFFAGGRQPYVTVEADDYGYANFNANMSQLLESVDVFYSPQPSFTNYTVGGGTPPPPSLISPLGYYPPQVNQERRGLKLLKEPPGWMTNFVCDAAYAGRSTGTTSRAVGDTMSPQTGENSPPPNWLRPDDALQEQQGSRALFRFAEHWYKTELLSQRYGEMSGRLRFDIAPGSIIQIEVPPRDRRPGGWFVGPPDDSMYATVTQVSYMINAEKATAGTSFALAHIRTAAENTADNFTNCENCSTPARPPLYRHPWRGAPLAVPVESIVGQALDFFGL
jgi:hypothetical protein